MLRRQVLIIPAALLALVAPQAASAAGPRTPAQCAKALNCPAEEINLMTMNDRLKMVQLMEAGPAVQFRAQSRWRNIEGVITFFRGKQWGPPNTWISWVDAGIVEGIERGLAMASGKRGGDFGNPGAALWRDYVLTLKGGGYPTRGSHDRAWGFAEQASTDDGQKNAEQTFGLFPSSVEKTLYDFSQLYRDIMRNKPEAAAVVAYYGQLTGQPEVTYRSRDFVDWFTDVGNPVPSIKGCEMAYRFGSGDIFGGLGAGIDILLTSIPDLLRDYFASQGASAASVRRFKPVDPARVSAARVRTIAPSLAAR